MTRFLMLCVLVFVGVFAWFVGSKLSADAIGMGVGVVFGVLAGVPTALLLMASNRRSQHAGSERYASHGGSLVRYDQPQSGDGRPPIIIVNNMPRQPEPSYEPYGGRQGYAPQRQLYAPTLAELERRNDRYLPDLDEYDDQEEW